jgi:hypothetical protein
MIRKLLYRTVYRPLSRLWSKLGRLLQWMNGPGSHKR